MGGSGILLGDDAMDLVNLILGVMLAALALMIPADIPIVGTKAWRGLLWFLAIGNFAMIFL